MNDKQKFKDHPQLIVWLRSNCSWDEVSNISNIGLVENERFTEKTRIRFFKLWLWSSMKPSTREQAIIWDKMGTPFVKRRIERCNKIISNLLTM